MTSKVITVTVPVTLKVIVDDNKSIPLDRVSAAMVEFIGQSYVHEFVAEQLFDTVYDRFRSLPIEGTDVKADVTAPVATIADWTE